MKLERLIKQMEVKALHSIVLTKKFIKEILLDFYDHFNDKSTHGVTGDIVGTTDTQTLTNKTINSNNNNITNIDNNNIKVNAGIDATKIANGTISNTEYQYLNGVTSSIQTQLNGKLTGNGNNMTVNIDGNGFSIENTNIIEANTVRALNGASGTFTAASGETITVSDGIITGIVP